MKTQFPFLVGLGVALAWPADAQHGRCEGPEDACKQILALAPKYDEASSKHDAAAVAALYAPDGILVLESPTLYGREAIEKFYEQLIKDGQLGTHSTEVDQAHVQGNMAWAIGHWSDDTGPSHGSHPLHGNWGTVYVLEGGTWKIRMTTALIVPER